MAERRRARLASAAFFLCIAARIGAQRTPEVDCTEWVKRSGVGGGDDDGGILMAEEKGSVQLPHIHTNTTTTTRHTRARIPLADTRTPVQPHNLTCAHRMSTRRRQSRQTPRPSAMGGAKPGPFRAIQFFATP